MQRMAKSDSVGRKQSTEEETEEGMEGRGGGGVRKGDEET